MTRKTSYEEVKSFIESIGYQLLSTEYINNKTKLDLICDKGHEISMTYSALKRGARCRFCGYDEMSKKKTLSYKDVKEYIESRGYKLVSTEYHRNNEKLKMICDKGHECEISFANFQQGKRCATCANERMSEERRHSYEYVKSYIESYGYKLISKEYINGDIPLDMLCDKGHKCRINFTNFQQGKRCRTCKNLNNRKRFQLDYDYVKSYIESYGFKLLSKEYINITEPLKIRCEHGHIFNRNFATFKVTQRCPICGCTKGEERVMNYLKKNNINYVYDSPYFEDLLSPKGNPLRPDFILPDYKIWIEYDGEFHYNKLYEDDYYEELQINDNIKNEYAKEHDWKLIRIPYWEMENIEEIINKELIN